MNFGRESFKKLNKKTAAFEDVSPDFNLEPISSSNCRNHTLRQTPRIQTKPNSQQATPSCVGAFSNLGIAQEEQGKSEMTVAKTATEKKIKERLKDLPQGTSDSVLHNLTKAQIKKPLKKRMTDLGYQLRSYTRGKREAEQEGKRSQFQEVIPKRNAHHNRCLRTVPSVLASTTATENEKQER